MGGQRRACQDEQVSAVPPTQDLRLGLTSQRLLRPAPRLICLLTREVGWPNRCKGPRAGLTSQLLLAIIGLQGMLACSTKPKGLKQASPRSCSWPAPACSRRHMSKVRPGSIWLQAKFKFSYFLGSLGFLSTDNAGALHHRIVQAESRDADSKMGV